MRDGVELDVTLYLPKGNEIPTRNPAIFTLTPYGSDTYHERATYYVP